MQNVESDLWRQVSASAWYRRPMSVEAGRLRRAEIEAAGRCAAVVAISQCDAKRIASQSAHRGRRVETVSPPFPAVLPAAPRVAGEPSLALSGSGGWWPNQDGARWFIERIWHKLQRAFPEALLHVYGRPPVIASQMQVHPAPVDSVDAFPEGAICVVPLHVASGVRMRILEAWARGLPVVATSVAARGLAVESGRELIVADDAQSFILALQRIQNETGFREHLIENGRAYLVRHHSIADTAGKLVNIYAEVRRGSANRESDKTHVG
jgi:polysaccharide biosynthesis protein PslH